MDINEYNSMVPIVYYGESITVSSIPDLPTWLCEIFKDKFNCYLDYSKTVKRKYIANHCFHCNALQGDNYLFEYIDSPFSLEDCDSYDNSSIAKQLKLYRIKLDFDIITNLSYYIMHDTEFLIETYSDIQDIEI